MGYKGILSKKIIKEDSLCHLFEEDNDENFNVLKVPSIGSPVDSYIPLDSDSYFLTTEVVELNSFNAKGFIFDHIEENDDPGLASTLKGQNVLIGEMSAQFIYQISDTEIVIGWLNTYKIIDLTLVTVGGDLTSGIIYDGLWEKPDHSNFTDLEVSCPRLHVKIGTTHHFLLCSYIGSLLWYRTSTDDFITWTTVPCTGTINSFREYRLPNYYETELEITYGLRANHNNTVFAFDTVDIGADFGKIFYSYDLIDWNYEAIPGDDYFKIMYFDYSPDLDRFIYAFYRRESFTYFTTWHSTEDFISIFNYGGPTGEHTELSPTPYDSSFWDPNINRLCIISGANISYTCTVYLDLASFYIDNLFGRPDLIDFRIERCHTSHYNNTHIISSSAHIIGIVDDLSKIYEQLRAAYVYTSEWDSDFESRPPDIMYDVAYNLDRGIIVFFSVRGGIVFNDMRIKVFIRRDPALLPGGIPGASSTTYLTRD